MEPINKRIILAPSMRKKANPQIIQARLDARQTEISISRTVVETILIHKTSPRGKITQKKMEIAQIIPTKTLTILGMKTQNQTVI